MMIVLPEGFTKLPSDFLPKVDEKVLLIDSSGAEFEGCLIEDCWGFEIFSWCAFDSEYSLSERVGEDAPVGWRKLND